MARVTSDLRVPLETLGDQFARMYWNQTVVFHLRQASSLTKESEVIKAIRRTADVHSVRHYSNLPSEAKAQLSSRMARILGINVLAAFHTTKPLQMPPLYEWIPKRGHIVLSAESHTLLKSQGIALETIANYHWADFLETTNRLAPRIIQKVKRDGARRRSLAPYLKILTAEIEERCFYCDASFDATVRPTVDHVIPWSFLVDDPLWDLVLACRPCNTAKSDLLPDQRFIDKLIERNAARMRGKRRHEFSLHPGGEEILRTYNAALSVEWPGSWSPLIVRDLA